MRIDGTFGAMPYLATDFEYELIANFLRALEGACIIRITYYLHQTLTVTQINEDHSAMVTAAMYPTVESDSLIQVLGINETTVIGAHGVLVVESRE